MSRKSKRDLELLEISGLDSEEENESLTVHGRTKVENKVGFIQRLKDSVGDSDWFEWGYILDWIACLVCMIIVGSIETFLSPHPVFYLEGDFSQSYPFSPETVPNWLLMLIMCIPPVITTTFQLLKNSDQKYHDIHHACLSWMESVAITLLVCQVLKYACGRHRPDFFSREALPLNEHELKDGYLSFPSGHSSGSFCVMTFLFWYLCGKTKLFYRGHFYLLLINAIPLYVAFWVAVTRLQNYRHDYIDVSAGCIIGFICGTFAYTLNFESPYSSNCSFPKNRKDGLLSL